MKTTFIGKEAESRVADHLKKSGFAILGQNWRTKVCEIDLIAKKENIVYFMEVKFRSSEKQGGGLEYITPAKLRRVRFAAEIWNQQNSWDGDYRLLAAAVSDNDIQIIEID
jgi:Holliday junction resolvase-like predicted endonuclease